MSTTTEKARGPRKAGAAPSPATGGSRGRKPSMGVQNAAGWLFSTPFLVLFTVFMAFPILATLVMSFTDFGLRNVTRPWEATGSRVAGLGVDLRDPSAIEAMADEAEARHGHVDVVCANAGVFPERSLREMTAADVDDVLAINLRGSILTTKAFLPAMERSGHGRVVLTSSITGPTTGYSGWSHYGASKAGQLGFLRSAALELAPAGITVNAVLPGNVRTEGLSELGEDYLRRMAATIPAGRLGETSDIAHAVLFLASDEASFVTGQTLTVDGGQTLPESLDSFVPFT